MDLVDEWATKIAEAVAPDEIDLAPLTAQAYIKGGKNKNALLQKPKGGVPGAFDPGGVTIAVLQWIIDAMSDAAPILYHILGATAVHISLYIHERLAQKQDIQPLPDEANTQLKAFTDTVISKLQPLGMSPELCELAAYRVLQVLLEDPANAKSFIKRIEGSSS